MQSKDTENFDIQCFTYGNLELIKSLSVIWHELSSNVDVQPICVNKGLISILLESCEQLFDYEVHINLYMSLGNLITSPNKQINNKAIEEGCLAEIIKANDDS